MNTETEQVIDRVAFILSRWYGDDKINDFIFLDGKSYHQHAAQAVLRAIVEQIRLTTVETQRLPEGK